MANENRPPHFIPVEKFKTYATKVMKEGLKRCPCCGHPRLDFGTDDTHTSYIISCRACKIMMMDMIFSHCRNRWNSRYREDGMASEIVCEYFDDNTGDIIKVEPDEPYL